MRSTPRRGPLLARLSARFFARPCVEVALDLLGCSLVHELDDGTVLRGRLVEVEAYLGDGTDPASHSHRGPTPRSRTMFGAPGRLYVYRSMGLHVCANVVCEPEGRGAAVLLRAAEVTAGVARALRSRGGRRGVELANGPAKLAQAFEITLAHQGHELLRGPLRIEPRREPTGPVHAGPRIGISRARELPYRFFLADSASVSRSSLNRRARPLATSASRVH